MIGRYRSYRVVLLLLDVLGLFAAFHLAYWLRFGNPAAQFFITNSYVYLISTILLFYFMELYDPFSPYSEMPLYLRSLGGVVAAGALSSLLAYALNDYSAKVHFGRGVMAISFVLFLPWAFLCRWFVMRRLDPDRLNVQLLLLASPEMAQAFQKELERRRSPWSVTYLLDRSAEKAARALQAKQRTRAVSDGILQLDRFLSESFSAVVVATDRLASDQISKLLDARMNGLRLYDLSAFYERYFFKLPIFYVRDSWFLLNRGFLILENRIGRRIKLWMDKVLALLFLIPALPVLLVVAALIMIESGRPVFFTQERTGEGGRSFTVFKLRTMVKDAEKHGAQWAQANDMRITRLGKFLRATRLDELPQLLNILRGDMSFIGPRPERPVFNEMLEKEIPFYNLRHVVRPGLTGWAQVMYPYGASVEDSAQKLEYDLYYIKNFSFLLDFLILARTVKVVLFRRGR